MQDQWRATDVGFGAAWKFTHVDIEPGQITDDMGRNQQDNLGLIGFVLMGREQMP